MLFNHLVSVKKSFFFILLFILVINTSMFNPINGNYTPTDQKESLSPIKSRYSTLSSGRLHRFFKHHYYGHMEPDSRSLVYQIYELENGSWSNPKLVIGYEDYEEIGFDDHDPNAYYDNHLLSVNSSGNGFTLYYVSTSMKHNHEALCAKEYNEQRNEWSKQKILFGPEQIEYLLNNSKEPIPDLRWHIHSFYLTENNSFFVLWSFGGSGTNVYMKRFFISQYDLNGGLISSQIIEGECSYSKYSRREVFCEVNDSIYLYSGSLGYRTHLYSNGTWSSWQNTIQRGLASASRFSLVAERYSFYVDSDENPHYFYIDMVQEKNPLRYTIDISSIKDQISPFFEIEFEINNSLIGVNGSFIMGIISNDSIQLWEYTYPYNWKLISSLDYYPLSSQIYGLDIIQDGDTWRFFWWQGETQSSYYEDIFTVKYNMINHNWTSVTQITKRAELKRSETVSNFGIVILIMSLIFLSFTYRKKRIPL